MPTKVIDLDFDSIPDRIISLDEYSRAMILVRIKGRPVERVYVPVTDGIILGSDLRSAIARNAGKVFWQYYLGDIFSYSFEKDWFHTHPPATIAICSRDRAEDLQRCLEAIRRITDRNQDILVVDSCSKDDATKQVVGCFPGVRYVREERPGLDRARNRALREANHDIVAYIDDDAVPDPDWLHALTRNFLHPNVACVTGLTMPVELETVAQEYFEEHFTFSRGFEYIEHDWNNTHPIGAGRVGVGTNMALRRSVIDQVGPFDEALDAGTLTYSGGETEMFSRLLSSGYRIIYEPHALNWHRHRRSWKSLQKTIYGYSIGIYSAWTALFLKEKEWHVLPVALMWFTTGQIPMLLRSLLGIKGAPVLDLIFLEIMGALAGPWMYLKSSRQQYSE